ncbi:MAG: ATP-binding protein [Bacteroidales bacterium]|nr:ATP-binding protein [Bacteroidales bacterium]
MKNIIRPIYLDRIVPFVNKQLIKVLIGQRRVGKSFMLKQILEFLKEQNPEANFILIDKELHEFDKIKTYDDLMLYVESQQKNGMNYLFIDEIQEIDDFEKALRSLLRREDFDIYCTGSNATVLSGEFATLLSGRQILIRIHPLSYSEYLIFHDKKSSKENLFNYLTYGGLPFLINLQSEKLVVSEYLKNIYATILFRDIITRHKIRDVTFLENLIEFLADNTGCLFSVKNISDFLKSQNMKKSVPVVSSYINYLLEAFFINNAKRYDIQGKRIFEIGEKLYFEDLGIRNALTGFKPNQINKNIENAVYNHLLILGYEVFVGQNQKKEIDFIAQKDNETSYFQVAYLLNDDSTIKREFGNLLEIKDNYPKYVISYDDFQTPNTYKGVKHIILENFLLDFK